MAYTSLAQIEQAKKNLEAQFKLLEDEAKSFEKKKEGFKQLETEKSKFDDVVKKIAEKFDISTAELKSFFGPKPVIVFNYNDKFNMMKSYEWFPGKIGKAPTEFEVEKGRGAENMKQYLTEYGKKWIATTEGMEEFNNFITPKTKKKK